MSPEQWIACVPDFEAAGNLPIETMVHDITFVEEGAAHLRELLADRDRLAAELDEVRTAMVNEKAQRLGSEAEARVFGQENQRLAAELLAVREELGRVRRNHLRRMHHYAMECVFFRQHAQVVSARWERGIPFPERDALPRVRARQNRIGRFCQALRAALSQPTKTGGG